MIASWVDMPNNRYEQEMGKLISNRHVIFQELAMIRGWGAKELSLSTSCATSEWFFPNLHRNASIGCSATLGITTVQIEVLGANFQILGPRCAPTTL